MSNNPNPGAPTMIMIATKNTPEPMSDTLAVLAALVAAGAVETLQRMLDLAREPRSEGRFCDWPSRAREPCPQPQLRHGRTFRPINEKARCRTNGNEPMKGLLTAMINVLENVREVKTPQPPPRDDDPTARRDRAWHSDPARLAGGRRPPSTMPRSWKRSMWRLTMCWRWKIRGGAPCDVTPSFSRLPVALAEHLASGAWMRDQP